MNIKTVSVTYGVKRSRQYQSVDVSMTSEVSLDEGEVMQDAFKLVIARMAPLVEAESDAALSDITRELD